MKSIEEAKENLIEALSTLSTRLKFNRDLCECLEEMVQLGKVPMKEAEAVYNQIISQKWDEDLMGLMKAYAEAVEGNEKVKEEMKAEAEKNAYELRILAKWVMSRVTHRV